MSILIFIYDKGNIKEKDLDTSNIDFDNICKEYFNY